MKDYDEDKELSCLKYWDANNLYGWAMPQKLPVNNFVWIEGISQFNKDFIKFYNEECDKEYFLEVDVQYPEKLQFLPERMKFENFEKLVTNLHDKSEYLIHIRNLKQALNNELVLKKVHRVLKSNQNAWLKPDIDMNTKLRKKTKNNFWKDFRFWKSCGKCERT